MTAVIYARYSSDNQREESIEGQIRECTAYAEKNGITIVKHYIDRALSAKTDNRPDFQQMIKDSEKRLFDIVLVWKLDRFARNRYDSAHYEYQLERNHVKLVSATEPISDSPAGIMVKSMLTTKLFCGMCGAMMFGECGTSRNKNVHHYYKCANAKRTKTCKKKTVRKEWLEDLVVNETMKMIRDDDCIRSIVDAVMILQEQENTVLPLLEKQMKDIERGIENLLNAIQEGILTSSTKGRLEKLEAQQKELEIRIAKEKLAKPKVSADFVKFWLTNFRKLDPNVKSHRETLINTFVNAVYLYDEKVLITFNYKDGTKTITFDEIAAKNAPGGNGSDLGCFAPPRTPVSNGYRSFCFICLAKGVARVDSNSIDPPNSPAGKKAPVQQRRPLPAAETGRSCWGCGQQDARVAQGTMQPLGAATRVPLIHPRPPKNRNVSKYAAVLFYDTFFCYFCFALPSEQLC